jgi:nucleotide-binding universal stress UspA family protein
MSRRKQILIALDASSQSLAALEAAVEIAHQRGAELLGVFVEDEDLLRVTSSSVAREVATSAAETRDLKHKDLESIFRSLASHARNALEMAAERRRIPWSFEVVRGAVMETLTEMIKEAEVVAMGSLGSRWPSENGFGSTTMKVLKTAKGGVFIARKGKSITFPVTVVCKSLEESKTALEAAFSMGYLSHHYFNVLYLPSENPLHEFELRQWLTQVSQDRAVLFRMFVIDPPTMMNVAGYLQAFRPGTLILPDLDWLKKAKFLKQLQHLECPVYLIRGMDQPDEEPQITQP